MQVTRGVVWLARSGYAARGLVYGIVAFFAALAALGAARTVDTKGAIEELLTQPFGAVLLWLVAIGLFAHVATCTPKARNTSAVATVMTIANHAAQRRRIHKPTPATM